jgi:dye decolorizing peroxidase
VATVGERISRRTLLGAGAAAAGIAGVGLTATAGACGLGSAVAATEPFHGVHQAGIATRPQAYTTLVALDLRPGHADRATVRSIMRLWSEDAVRLTQGLPALADTEPELAADPARYARMSAAAIAHVRTHFDPDRAVHKLIAAVLAAM